MGGGGETMGRREYKPHIKDSVVPIISLGANPKVVVKSSNQSFGEEERIREEEEGERK